MAASASARRRKCVLLSLYGKRNQDVHIADREKARLAAQHTLIPVTINLIGQDDDVALFKAQLTLAEWLEGVECPATRLVKYHFTLLWMRHAETHSGETNKDTAERDTDT